uniref:Uncharacterized protein n=1 Tax=Physcomitrium patens TaxID=3218 RepID=A0A2K1IZD5_PHYPA|nr:hypothetical protein PHYPA_024453 [Physcomitrium patens]
MERTPREGKELGFKLIHAWIWEYVLKHTVGVNIIQELTKLLPFPIGVLRLRQMMLIKDLIQQLGDPIPNEIDVDLALQYLEGLENSLASKPAEELEESVRGGLLQPALERKDLERPLLELKSELRTSLGEKRVDAQQAKVIRDEFRALAAKAWILLGPLVLEEFAASTIAGKRSLRAQSSVRSPHPVAIPDSEDRSFHDTQETLVDRRFEQLEGALRASQSELQNILDVKIAEVKRSVVVLEDAHHSLKKLVKDQAEVCKQHVRLKNPGTTSQCLGLSVLNLPPLAHAPGLEDDNMYEDKDRPSSNAHCSQLSSEYPHPSNSQDPYSSPSHPLLLDPGLHNIKETARALESSWSPSKITGRVGFMHGGQREKRPFQEIDLCGEVLICNSEQTVRECKHGESLLGIGSGSTQRRTQKKWSNEEVELLKRGVQEHGKGHWKKILNDNADAFHGRTEVDLKDKWRNLEKYERL